MNWRKSVWAVEYLLLCDESAGSCQRHSIFNSVPVWARYTTFLDENIIVANDVSSLLVQYQWSSEILIYRQWLSEILIFRLWLGVPAIEMKQSMKQKYSTFVQGIQKVARSDWSHSWIVLMDWHLHQTLHMKSYCLFKCAGPIPETRPVPTPTQWAPTRNYMLLTACE